MAVALVVPVVEEVVLGCNRGVAVGSGEGVRSRAGEVGVLLLPGDGAAAPFGGTAQGHTCSSGTAVSAQWLRRGEGVLGLYI